MDKRKIIFRVDGGSKMGLGHISRCCALASMLKDNFEVYFYTRVNSSIIIADIKNYCANVFSLNDAVSYDEEATQWVSVLTGNEIVVLDGYNFNTCYQKQIKTKGCRLICIDDIYAYHFIADAVINHAPGVDKYQYSCESYTKLYLGTEYVLLKKIFLNEATIINKEFDTQQSAILICFGGADPENATHRVLEEILQLFPDKKIAMVVGSAYKHLQLLRKVTEINSNVSLHINVKPEEIFYLMKQSHIAITAASTIALEYICVKGNLFLKQTADNQRAIYEALIEKRCAYAFDMIKYHYAENKNINNQYSLIDGKSSSRLLKIFNELSHD